MSIEDGGGRIVRYRNEIRAGLIALGVPIAVTGGWALFAPHSWYADFPVGTGNWISSLGPYDEHLVRDFGSVYLGLGLLLLVAAVLLGRQLVVGSLGMLLVFAVPHFIFHLTKLDAFSTANNIVNMLSLAGTVVLPPLLIALALRQGASADAGRASRETTIEGGIEYGTR